MSAGKVYGVRVTKGDQVLEETRNLWLERARELVRTKRREHPGAVVELLAPPPKPERITYGYDPNEEHDGYDRFTRRKS